MKHFFLFCSICFLFLSCDFSSSGKTLETEPPYTAQIAWDSGLITNDPASHMIDGDYVYFYERPPEYDYANIYTLTKVNAQTGQLVWRSVMFSDILFGQPIAIGGYMYVFLEPNGMLCFDKETGEHTATAGVFIDNKEMDLEWNITSYQQYLYMHLWNSDGTYFTRLDVNEISHTGNPDTLQAVSPEILWQPESKCITLAKPVIANNRVYTSTTTIGTEPLEPVELAGFDIDTKEMVFHTTFGGYQDGDIPFPETGGPINPILIHGDILYYLSWSISAWNLKTGELLYHHIISADTPRLEQNYATNIVQAVYHRGNIYYTSSELYETAEDRNIFCINALTGKLVWSAIATGSETLETNPTIAYDKLYVSHYYGCFRVYEPETGKLIGVDKSFHGAAMGRTVLYKDYMLCIRRDPDNGDGRLVAVYVGK